jgi:hypothetical protein
VEEIFLAADADLRTICTLESRRAFSCAEARRSVGTRFAFNLSQMPRALLQSLLVAGLVSPGSAVAEPMDLNDFRPRWVTIAFEESPPHQPGRLDHLYAPELPAWLEPEAPGRLRVTLARGLVERYLLAAADPKPGSFGDFVWMFDASSGDVISARLTGTVRKRIDWGLFTSTVDTDIRIDLDTRGPAGFGRPRHLLGQLLFDFCDGADRDRCTPVVGVPYERDRGYVNAVGKIDARSRSVHVETFAPLGEAVFSEVPVPPVSAVQTVSAAASP